MTRKHNLKRSLKIGSKEYICLLTKGELNYFKIVDLNKVQNIKLVTPNNLLFNLSYNCPIWTGEYNNIEYILTKKVRLDNSNLVLSKENTLKKKGIKIQLKGRLKGVSKAVTYKDSIGQIRTHTFEKEIDYSQKAIQTKWGKFGLKIFISN